MKLAIASSSGFINEKLLEEALHGKQIEHVKTTTNDRLVVKYCIANNIPYEVIPHEFKRYGNNAIIKRNFSLLNNVNLLLVFWNGSKGTGHLIKTANDAGVNTQIIKFNNIQ